MAFTEIELKRIDDTVGTMCKQQSPEELRDDLRVIYEVKGHDVTVYEEKAGRGNPQQWSRVPVAKFRYVRKENIWKLYWMRTDMKWHLYEMPHNTKTLEALLREVERDPYGAFFG